MEIDKEFAETLQAGPVPMWASVLLEAEGVEQMEVVSEAFWAKVT